MKKAIHHDNDEESPQHNTWRKVITYHKINFSFTVFTWDDVTRRPDDNVGPKSGSEKKLEAVIFVWYNSNNNNNQQQQQQHQQQQQQHNNWNE